VPDLDHIKGSKSARMIHEKVKIREYRRVEDSCRKKSKTRGGVNGKSPARGASFIATLISSIE